MSDQRRQLTRAMHWHDPTCPRLDGVCANNLISCIRCGSSKLLVSEDSKSLPGVLGPGSIYSPISQHTEIRLLVVHPGEFPEPVRCDMVTRAVGKAMYDYEAISYTWADETGDKTQSGLIFVNSTPIPVTRNCEMALRRVRWRSYERRIWIDAVCIDQTNIDERGHQVRLMPEIYARAKRVLIYIGEAADQSSSALQFIANGGFGNTPTQADLEVAKKALDRLLSRRYFSRIWVLQEIALARESKLICGDTTITWQLLQPKRLAASELFLNPDNPRIPPALHFDHRVYSKPGQFLNLLDLASRCQSEDPRDKVYSILGLVSGWERQCLEANYTLSVDQVYINTALCLARVFGWGRVFYHATVREPKIANLPSWVPDWSVSPSHSERRARGASVPNSSLPKRAKAYIAGSRILTLSALGVGDNTKSQYNLAQLAGTFGRIDSTDDSSSLESDKSPISNMKMIPLLSSEMAKYLLRQLVRLGPCLCFARDSPLFASLRYRIGIEEWRYIKTGIIWAAFKGRYLRLKRSPYNSRFRGEWAYIASSRIEKLLQVSSYDDLKGIVARSGIEQEDLTRVFPRTEEWDFIIGALSRRIAKDLLRHTLSRLRELSFDGGEQLAKTSHPETQIVRKAAIQWLEANHSMEIYDVCIS